MVKIKNVFGDEYKGKQKHAVYQKRYGKQIRRIKEDKKANKAPGQVEQQQRFKIGISWYKGLSYFEKEGLKLFLNEQGISLTPQQYAIKTALDRGKVTKIVLGEQVVGGEAPADWDAEGWNYRQEITLMNNTASDLTNYQVKLELDASKVGAHFDWARMGADLRFYDENGNKLSYYIESWDEVNKTATVWVKVGLIPGSGSTTIKMYYGNSEAVSESDGEAVFEFFDDFESGTFDASKWADTGEWAIYSATAKGNYSARFPGGSTGRELKTVNLNLSNIIIEFDYYKTYSTGGFSGEINYFMHLNDLGNWVYSLADANNTQKYYDGAWRSYPNAFSWGTGKWYHIKIVIDHENGTHHAWVDDTDIGTVTTLDEQSYVQYIQFAGATTSGNDFIIDNVRIRKYAEQEPTAEFGAEEEYTTTGPVTVTVEHVIVEHSGIMNVYYYDENNELIEEKTDLSDIANGDIATRLDFINRTRKTIRTVIIESISGVLNKWTL